MKLSTFATFIFILSTSQAGASIITSNSSEFFLNLASQPNANQSLTNEWQIGMYNGGDFELFDYSGTTVLGRPAIIGWVNQGFHAAFLNQSDQDEVFPGNIFAAGQLTLHPGQSGAEIVLRYLVQRDGIFGLLGNFFALDTIECASCNSDGVNVSVLVNGSQLNDDSDIIGFGGINSHSVSGSNLQLQKGDFIDFVVKPKSNFYDDATRVSVSVSREVSEPVTVALMLIGIAFVVMRRSL